MNLETKDFIKIIINNKEVNKEYQTMFKEFMVSSKLLISEDALELKEIVCSMEDLIIDNTEIMYTEPNISLEGQKLTGKILQVAGRIKVKIVYLTNNLAQTSQGALFMIPFTNYVMLPEDYEEGNSIVLIGRIVDKNISVNDFYSLNSNFTILLSIDDNI